MPTVPRQQRQVALDALPGARLTAAETPESLGARPNDPIAAALEGVGAKTAALGEQLFGQAVDEEKKRADQIAVLNADNSLAAWTNKRVYDPNSGALTATGPDAFGLPEQINDEFTTQADTIAAGLTTPEQKMAFNRIRTDRQIELSGTIYKHVYAETQQYHAKEVDSAIDNNKNAAMAQADDPRAVSVAIDRSAAAIGTLKLGPEETKKQTDAARSAILVGVIETQLSQNKVTAAQSYFDETKSLINGDQINRIEKALKEGTIRKQAQDQADEIIKAGGTLTEQRDKARALTDKGFDADVRDRAMEYIEHNNAVNDKAKRDDLEAASTSAFNLLDRSRGDLRTIPSTAWESFPGSIKASLRAYSEKLAKGEPVETDWSTWTKLMGQAGTDPAAFANINMMQYRGRLSDEKFSQLTEVQLSIRNKEASRADVGDFQSREHLVSTTLDSYGIETRESKQTPEQRKAIGELYRLLDQRTATQAALTGKKPTNQDVQSALDQILSTSLDVKGSWWNFWPRNGAFFDSTKPFLGKDGTTITIGDVPQVERTQIEAALRRKGRPVNDTTVLDLFIDQHSRQTK